MSQIRLEYQPQAKQRLLHSTVARQVLYGGAAGGGKSTSVRWHAINLCLRNPGLQAYVFRRTLGELEDNHIRWIKQEIPANVGSYNETRKELSLFNNSIVRFCYCEKEADVYRYQGTEMHVVLIDEASQFTPTQILYLRTRNRLGSFKPSAGWVGILPQFVMASNPGGPSHQFLKETFINCAEPGTLFNDRTWRDVRDANDKGRLSIYIPARMNDNAYLDTDYAGSFAGLSPEMARAYRDGDWDSVVGQALHNLSRDRHQIRAFTPPKHWTRMMSMDWGTARPFSIGWYCVSTGAYLQGREGWPDVWLPEGAVIRYGEWYGYNGRRNQGLRMESQAVARRILDIEAERGHEIMDYRIADSAMWAKTDGISIAERMQLVDPRFVLRPAQKDRAHNYAEFLARLAGNATFTSDGKAEDHPMFFATANCTQFWATVPSLTLDETDPDKGPDSRQEDHIYDECAYLLRSRPYVTTEGDREEVEREELLREFKNLDPYAT